MTKEEASAGVLDTPFGKFARLQILTIEDLFAGKKPAVLPEDPAAVIEEMLGVGAMTPTDPRVRH
jgi:hypothetical protein